MKTGPQAMSSILAELMARSGYARVQGAAEYEAAWREAAGELMAQYTRVGSVRRGKLEIVVAHSTLMQELGFQKPALIKRLNELLAGQTIADLRFRVGPVA